MPDHARNVRSRNSPRRWKNPASATWSSIRQPAGVRSRPARASIGRRTRTAAFSSSRANHMGVLRGLVSAYSQKDVAGTMQRFLLPSHPRQCGLATLRILVTGCPPNCGGPGMPQRAMTSSRSPSGPTRTIGASWSGGDADRQCGQAAWRARHALVADRRALRLARGGGAGFIAGAAHRRRRNLGAARPRLCQPVRRHGAAQSHLRGRRQGRRDGEGIRGFPRGARRRATRCDARKRGTTSRSRAGATSS